jgi:3,4-dihydroxy 2-butanone 4-phosphate synthase/GTP cyclohydrolase II
MGGTELSLMRDGGDARARELAAKISPAEPGFIEGVDILDLPGHTLGTAAVLFGSADGRVAVCGDAAMTRDFFDARRGYYNSVDFERASRSIEKLAGAADIVVPGHVFPLRYRPGGVLVRTGQTEGSVDLTRLAGINPSAVICEIMNEDGTMSRMPQLEVFAAEHNIKILTIADLIAYRTEHDNIVHQLAEANLPTEYGDFRIIGFNNEVDGQEALALVKGDVSTDDPVLVRVHSACLTGDAFGSKRCECGAQLHEAMRMISTEGRGVVVYMFQEGRGIGIMNKIKAYALQDSGCDTVEANRKLGFKDDLRDYGFGAQILTKLGIKNMRLITNNPVKISGLDGHGLHVTESVPLVTGINEINEGYMLTKQEKMGHKLGLKK